MHTATLLQGACDTHVHFAPDIVPRLLSGPQLAAEARELGMRAILLKNHYCPTYLTASAIDEMFPGLRVFGGLVLNAACGGLNPDAVRCALRMGAKEIWMPTVSSLRHVTFFHAPPETLCVPVFDDRGRPAPGLPEILDLIAHSGAILGTGHLSPFECEALVSLAKQAGVRKILVTHPEFEAVDMDLDTQVRLAGQGVFFERCCHALYTRQHLPLALVARQIRCVGIRSTILASDMGQLGYPEPAHALLHFCESLMRFGFSRRISGPWSAETRPAFLGFRRKKSRECQILVTGMDWK